MDAKDKNTSEKTETAPPIKSDMSVTATNDEEMPTVEDANASIVEIDKNYRDVLEINSQTEDDSVDQYHLNEQKLCDTYDPSEPIPIQFDREQSKLIKLFEKIDLHMNGDSDFNSIANKAFGSSFFDGTVKIINTGQICQKITDSPKGKKTKYIKESNDDGENLERVGSSDGRCPFGIGVVLDACESKYVHVYMMLSF